MKRFCACVGLFSLLLTACGGQSSTSGGSASQAQTTKSPIVVGDLFSMTTSASLVGKEEEKGRQMAVKEINAAGGVNGHPLKLVKEDVAFNNQTAINALQKVMGSRPSAIMGPVWSNEVLAMEPELLKDKVPMLYAGSAGSVTKQGNPWMFRDLTDVSYSEPVLAKWFLQRVHAIKPAIIYSNDAFGISLKNAVVSGLKQIGLTPVTVQSMDDAQTDISAEITAIKNSGADALFGENVSPTGAVVVKSLYQQGEHVPLMMANPILSTSELKLIPSVALNGVYVDSNFAPTESTDPAVKAWVKKFEKVYNYTPSWAEAVNYGAIYLLADVFKTYGTKPSQVADGLHKVTYKGIFTTYHADSEGNLWHTDDVLQFGKGKHATLVKAISVPQ